MTRREQLENLVEELREELAAASDADTANRLREDLALAGDQLFRLGDGSGGRAWREHE